MSTNKMVNNSVNLRSKLTVYTTLLTDVIKLLLILFSSNVRSSLIFTASLTQMKEKDKRKMAHWVLITCV